MIPWFTTIVSFDPGDILPKTFKPLFKKSSLNLLQKCLVFLELLVNMPLQECHA